MKSLDFFFAVFLLFGLLFVVCDGSAASAEAEKRNKERKLMVVPGKMGTVYLYIMPLFSVGFYASKAQNFWQIAFSIAAFHTPPGSPTWLFVMQHSMSAIRLWSASFQSFRATILDQLQYNHFVIKFQLKIIELHP